MTHRDLIVVGASLGGFEAFKKFLRGLTPDIDAAILFAMHVSPSSPGYLAELFQGETSWRVQPARDGARPEPGHVYIAVPDHHLMLEADRMRLTRGPRESRARPAVDVLFRSAAHHHGRKVIGIVLTGMLDDGTAGLWAIKDRGGIAIVQDPNEAEQDSMPCNALKHVEVDFILPVHSMPERLRSLTREPLAAAEPARMTRPRMKTEIEIARDGHALDHGVLSLGETSPYTCPDCHGSMVRIEEGPIKRFRCHTGHAYSELTLAEGSSDTIKKTMWAALAQLEEHYLFLQSLVKERAAGDDEAAHYQRRAQEVRHVMNELTALLNAPALQSSEGQP
jgi:two-component system chemotaxis response regulator CheB